jgi:hypothetical protein
MPIDKREKLELIFKNELISKEEYESIKSLKFNSQIYEKSIKNEDKMDIDEKGKIYFDDLMLNNPKKSLMGLMSDGIKQVVEEDNKPKKKKFGRRIRKTRTVSTKRRYPGRRGNMDEYDAELVQVPQKY